MNKFMSLPSWNSERLPLKWLYCKCLDDWYSSCLTLNVLQAQWHDFMAEGNGKQVPHAVSVIDVWLSICRMKTYLTTTSTRLSNTKASAKKMHSRSCWTWSRPSTDSSPIVSKSLRRRNLPNTTRCILRAFYEFPSRICIGGRISKFQLCADGSWRTSVLSPGVISSNLTKRMSQGTHVFLSRSFIKESYAGTVRRGRLLDEYWYVVVIGRRSSDLGRHESDVCIWGPSRGSNECTERL